jgi:Cryptococcal mannosyltransferase 1
MFKRVVLRHDLCLLGALVTIIFLCSEENGNQRPAGSSPTLTDTIVMCSCPPDSNNFRKYLKQSAFDVCQVACTGSNKFAASSSEADLIMDGFEQMSKFNVEACILCRDAVELLPNITLRIRALSRRFSSMHLTIVENDSRDRTVAAVKEWAAFEKKYGTSGLSVDIEHHTLRLTRPEVLNAGYDDVNYASARISRYHRLSLLRNRCLLSAMRRKNVDQFIVIDADTDVNTAFGDVYGVAHSYGLNTYHEKFQWDVVCSNSLLRQPKGVQAYLYRNISEDVPKYARNWVFRDSLAFRDSQFSLDTFRFHERRIHTPYDEPFFVDTCFGGMAIYDLRGKTEKWHACSYEAFKDDDCEHVSFHVCLKENGWRILFNPRLTVQYL